MNASDLILESQRPADYLAEIPPVIEWHSDLVRSEIAGIMDRATSELDRARMAFETARDRVAHSFDTGHPVVSISAADALRNGEGICFAKAHLLASLLRGMGIPCGFCYQRVLRKGTLDQGYALHGLNAVYLRDTGWFRLDPRGNKPGINAQFTTDHEQLAYPIRKQLGEVDYPQVFRAPIASVLEAMHGSKTCAELFCKRPEMLVV
jgi:transglutaminase-like putative cysteine protease